MEKNYEEYKPHPADQYIMQRFVFEPRGEYMGSKSWLIIYDKLKKRYVRQEEHEKRYATFANSWECIKYLRTKFVDSGESKEGVK